jgi:tRNA1Val (adenine37-N6)-methyltransferase
LCPESGYRWCAFRGLGELPGATRILDIGTGTGVLALIAAQRNAQATIDAVEIDDAAAEQAAENAAASPWSGRVHVHRMDVRRMHSTDPFDLIICNPPYYEGYSPASPMTVGVAKHSNELRFQELVEAVDGCWPQVVVWR